MNIGCNNSKNSSVLGIFIKKFQMHLIVLFLLRVVNKTIPPDEQITPLDASFIIQEMRKKRDKMVNEIHSRISMEAQKEKLNPSNNPDFYAEKIIENKILWHNPTQLKSRENQLLTLNVEPSIGPIIFCKFNTKVVAGWKAEQSENIICPAPYLKPGFVNLSISADKLAWTRQIEIEVISTSSSIPSYIYFIGALLIFCIIVLMRTTLKNSFEKREDKLLSNDSDIHMNTELYDSMNNDLKRRKKVTGI
ncbi:hypothetical protein TRFO_08321 [Tritrichomonas foetus]|uniref:IPT/TIG domain-containing protein n=1 Tax=Tritrichomonas foetus TaxID=1144522 RepID=A0A1J4JKM5_9EUKA|nr:hypothetical protein TRFO_08321 [Tritrichomonas foetus]|eukprot:OHS99680.1 hypothetical protein TRFO_08321 [Tritrichomonas foetus]